MLPDGISRGQDEWDAACRQLKRMLVLAGGITFGILIRVEL